MDIPGSNHGNSKLHVHLQKDYEEFLNSFERPAQIYRVLRDRHLEQPLFLNRNLSYMRRKYDNPKSSRPEFNLGEIIDSCQSEDTFFDTEIDSDSSMKIEFDNFTFTYPTNAIHFSNYPEWRVELELKRPSVSLGKFDRTLLAHYSIPQRNNSTDLSHPPLNIPFTSFKSQSISILKKTSLVFSIECIKHIEIRNDLSQTNSQLDSDTELSLPKFINTSKTQDSPIKPTKINQEPLANETNSTPAKQLSGKKRPQTESNGSHKKKKRRKLNRTPVRNRSLRSSAENSPTVKFTNKQSGKHKIDESPAKVKSDLLLEKIRNICPKSVNNVVELKLFSNKSDTCLLKKGKYEIYFSVPFDSEKSSNSSDENDSIDSPNLTRISLSFTLNWTENPPTTRELTKTSTPLKRAIQRYRAKHKNCEISQTSTPQENMPIIYNFIYASNTYQQTQHNSRLECPLCALICPREYSLLQHLNSTHPRLEFRYIPSDTLTAIDVRVNNEYDGSFSGDPKELGRYGVALWRYGPIRRKPYTSIVHLSPKGVKREENIAKFLGSYENENDQYMGLDRVFFHSRTCHPILPSEINSDSEDDNNEWLISQTKKLINDFTDVNSHEKEIMKLWNIHMIETKIVGDCHISQACLSFATLHGKTIREKSLSKNFLAHLVQLCDQGLITVGNVQDSISIITEHS